jgi:cytochrome c
MTPLRIVAACAVGLLSSLLLARVHPFGDAGLYAARPSTAPIMERSAPSRVRELLITKCADCHSTQTHAPIYGRFAPISWLMERDILEGRRHMNLSAWDSYTPDEQQVLEAKILQQTRSRTMPLAQYRILHRNSVTTAADLDILSQWAHQASVPQTTLLHQFSPGSAAEGKDVFERRCTGCHSLDQNREGPKLGGVYGRTSGQLPGFPYSPALQNAHIVWDEMTLDRWLTDPDAYVSGNNMDFRVTKPQERPDLIRFLKESAAK